MKTLEFTILALAIICSILQVYAWIDNIIVDNLIDKLWDKIDPGAEADGEVYHKVILSITIVVGLLWSSYFTFF